MIPDILFQTIAERIQSVTGKPFKLLKTVTVGGGCINSTYRLEGKAGQYFVKLNHKDCLPMFEAESLGLEAIAVTDTVRVPKPVCCGLVEDQSFLAMEFIQLRSTNSVCDRLLGQKLAAMHDARQAFFGWHWDNTIGSTPQINTRHDNWIEFFAKHRLGFQLSLAKSQGYAGKLQREGERLIECLPDFFVSYRPKPSLLHGDLWGGNYAGDDTSQPVIFDPACYFGDREADIAMTELFGGFGREFLAAYDHAYPLDIGYKYRKSLYNLYHIINHINLFGSGYLAQAENVIARLIAEVR